MLRLIFAAVLVVSASACCFPDLWEAECYFSSGNLNETNQEGHYMEGYFTMSYDKASNKMSEYQHLTYDGNPVEQHLVFDFNLGIMFISRNNSCDKFQIENPKLPDCLPEGNTQPMNYGYAGSKNYVNALGYSVTQNNSTSYWSVTADTCTPIAMDSVLRRDKYFQITMLTFQNVTTGVKDTSVFNVPTLCFLSGPPKPIVLAGLGKRSIMYQQ